MPGEIATTSFADLPSELKRVIALRLPPRSYLNLCQVNKKEIKDPLDEDMNFYWWTKLKEEYGYLNSFPKYTHEVDFLAEYKRTQQYSDLFIAKSQQKFFALVRAGDVPQVKAFKETYDLTAVDEVGNTAFDYAQGNDAMLNFLYTKKQRKHDMDDGTYFKEKCVCHRAVLSNKANDIQEKTDGKFFEEYFGAAMRDINGWTPLHTAAACGASEEILQTLKDKGVKYDYKDECELNALDIAYLFNQIATAELIKQLFPELTTQITSDYDFSLLMPKALKHGHDAVVKQCLRREIDVNKLDNKNNNYLHLALYACKRNKVNESDAARSFARCVYYLLFAGVSLRQVNDAAETPLRVAINIKDEELYEAMLKVYLLNCSEDTILNYFAEQLIANNLLGILLVLRHGVDLPTFFQSYPDILDRLNLLPFYESSLRQNGYTHQQALLYALAKSQGKDELVARFWSEPSKDRYVVAYSPRFSMGCAGGVFNMLYLYFSRRNEQDRLIEKYVPLLPRTYSTLSPEDVGRETSMVPLLPSAIPKEGLRWRGVRM